MNFEEEWMRQALTLCMIDSEGREEKETEKRKKFSELEKQYLQFNANEKSTINNVLEKGMGLRDSIYVLSGFNRYMNIEAFKIKLINNVLKGDFDCYLSSMMEYQILGKIDGCYVEKRILHRANIEKFAKELGVNNTYHPVQTRNNKRIVIITEMLMEIEHAPTRVVLNTAYMLQERMGYEVLIFACPTDRGIEEDLWNHACAPRSSEVFEKYIMRFEYREATFEGYQINMKPDCPKEYSMMLSLIDAWNPYFVFSLGVCNPVADLPGLLTTSVAMSMSINCPVSDADILLRFTKQEEEIEKEYTKILGQTGQTQIYLNGEMPTLIEKEQEIFTRKELSLPEEDFLIAVVGNRLNLEIDEAFIQAVEEVLDKTENVSFVFIGRGECFLDEFDAKYTQKRIFHLGFCRELMKTYGTLDLYVNPKRMGGGYSSLFAVTAELPVVTFPDCDVSYNVGNDFVVENYEEMVLTICRYANDKKFYAEKKNCAVEVAKKNTEEKLKQYLEEMIEKISDAMHR